MSAALLSVVVASLAGASPGAIEVWRASPQSPKVVLAPSGKERPMHRPDVVKYLPFERSADTDREVHMQVQVIDVTDARSAAVAHLLAAYLHERLFWKLRKNGHVYSPYVGTSFQEWLDFISIAFTVTRGATSDLHTVVLDEIDELAEGHIDDESWARAKALARQRLRDLEENPVAYAADLQARGRGVTTVGPEVRAALDALEKKDILDPAALFLSRKRSVSYVFGRTRSSSAPHPSDEEEAK